MNSYLIKYKPSNNVFRDEFSKVVEAKNFKEAATHIDAHVYQILDIKMLVNPTGAYRNLKNHLHNTLELTKEDVRKMVGEAIENIVERRLDVFLKYEDSIERIIDDAVREKTWNMLFMSNENKLDSVLQDKVVKAVTAHMVKGIGLEVTLKDRRKKSVTAKGGGCPCLVCSGYCACKISGHHDNK